MADDRTQRATLADTVLGISEIQLSLVVLGFGGFLMLLQTVVILRAHFDHEAAIRILVLTLVIIAALFTASAGFAREDIAPIIGLFGTIIGYLLGRQSSSASPEAGK